MRQADTQRIKKNSRFLRLSLPANHCALRFNIEKRLAKYGGKRRDNFSRNCTLTLKKCALCNNRRENIPPKKATKCCVKEATYIQLWDQIGWHDFRTKREMTGNSIKKIVVFRVKLIYLVSGKVCFNKFG